MQNYTKKIVIGKIAEYYTIPLKIKNIDLRIEEIRSALTSAKSPVFDKTGSSASKPHDEKLVDMIMKVQGLEAEKDKLMLRKDDLSRKLGISELSDTEIKVMNAVFSSKNYAEAGSKTGYSQIQVYRIITKIYEKLGNNLA